MRSLKIASGNVASSWHRAWLRLILRLLGPKLPWHHFFQKKNLISKSDLTWSLASRANDHHCWSKNKEATSLVSPSETKSVFWNKCDMKRTCLLALPRTRHVWHSLSSELDDLHHFVLDLLHVEVTNRDVDWLNIASSHLPILTCWH